MKIIKTVEDFFEVRKNIDSLGFVPTMGSLHKGHEHLIGESVKKNKCSVVSIFVNPKQFNDKSDYETYPDTIKKDLKLCEALGVDYVFTPKSEDIYSKDDSLLVVESAVSKNFEGEHRPGHFDGVLLVLLKLLNIVRADNIYMGEKDYQQVLLTKKLCKEFFIKTKVKVVKTFRDKSGLPFSSRNVKLSPEGLMQAKKVAEKFHKTKTKKDFLKGLDVDLDYYGELEGRVLMAHRIEGVRILDNREA